MEVIFLPKRPTFTTPVQKKSGGSWFACAWFTFGLGIGQAITFWDGKTASERPFQTTLPLDARAAESEL